ncbi:MAG: dimethylsulfonioproprionate lyase family protein, partial [Alphaproteobacteria bacterium]
SVVTHGWAPPAAGPDVPALAHLAPALTAPGAHPLARTLAPIARVLPWTRNEHKDKSPALLAGQTYCEVVGPDGALRHDRCRVGLYLQAPGLHYPAHSHAAVELYFVVAGDPVWWQAGKPEFEPRPGALIHHASFQSHAMTTQALPLLSLWTWTGDISFASYRMDPGRDG